MKKLTHFSLFTGIGGIDLAAEWAGFETVGQCEKDDYAYAVLDKHWPNIRKWRDVSDVTRNDLVKQSIEKITVLSAGFPCQPHSLAGKRMATNDKRDLWPETRRIICEVKPKWFLGENVPGLLSSDDGRFFGQILADLAKMGFDAWWGVYGSFHVGAPHKRERVFIVANSDSKRWNSLEGFMQNRCPDFDWKSYDKIKPNEIIDLYANAKRVLDNPERGVCRNDDGLSEGMDRLRCVGNAVNPYQVFPILKAIWDIENI